MNKFVIVAALAVASLFSGPVLAEDVPGVSSTHSSTPAPSSDEDRDSLASAGGDGVDSGYCLYRDQYGQRYTARCRGCEDSDKSIAGIGQCLRHLALRMNNLRSQVGSLDWSTNDTMLVELAIYKADLTKLHDVMKRSSLIPSKHLVTAGDALMARFLKIEADFAAASKALEEQPAAEQDPLADCKPNCG
ncbi:MAG: hypothetical protein DI585_01790 [Pseudomonas fluorescens]|nr:MAG: hypothetical protein DI585_01790 [Pseudomonas fluorescens]